MTNGAAPQFAGSANIRSTTESATIGFIGGAVRLTTVDFGQLSNACSPTFTGVHITSRGAHLVRAPQQNQYPATERCIGCDVCHECNTIGRLATKCYLFRRKKVTLVINAARLLQSTKAYPLAISMCAPRLKTKNKFTNTPSIEKNLI